MPNVPNVPSTEDCTVVTSTVLYPETRLVAKHTKVLDTHVNLGWLLSHFDAQIRYNLMTRNREVVIPGHYIFQDDSENASLSHVTYLATLNEMPVTNIDTHLDKLAQQPGNAYHPIVESMRETPWDNVPRLEKFIATVKAKDQPLANKLIRTWMMAAMAAAHSAHGFINQGVLVLQGPQKVGKTSWVKALDPINCGCVKESAFLDPSNKDSVAQLASYWIAELGELETIFRKSEIGRLKSYITTEFDYLRLPYAKKPTRLARRSVYVATVNDTNFLSDDTGNRRWWTVEVEEIQFDHGLDMQQVWAEVCHYWQSGEATDLDFATQSEVNISNEKHEKVDPLREKLLTSYDWASTFTRWLTATAVLEELGFTKPNRADATRMGGLLKNVVDVVHPKDRSTKVVRGYKLYPVPHLIRSTNFI